jgi:transmembrane sensor
MMKYRDYTAMEFANDSFFIRWVKNPDEDCNWFWMSFMKEYPASRYAIEEARMLVGSLYFPNASLTDEEITSMSSNLLMVLRAEREEKKGSIYRKKNHWPSQRGMRWLKIAAAVIIVPLVSLGIFLFTGHDENQVALAPKALEEKAEMISNSMDQKSVIFLNDGTKVWLNAESKIMYLKDFQGQSTREVYLEGEAFFDVAHNAEKPFVVNTSSIKIKVLGTSFNVKSYSGENTVETTLVRGKVRIEQSDVQGLRIGDVELKPNQRAVFNKESKVINIKEVVAANTDEWKQDRLVFDEESMDHVLLQLERWYDVKIHVQNRGRLDCKLTAKIEKETLEEVLKLIELSHDIHYRIEGKEVFIDGILCNTAGN